MKETEKIAIQSTLRAMSPLRAALAVLSTNFASRRSRSAFRNLVKAEDALKKRLEEVK
jgi:hypothetical protein